MALDPSHYRARHALGSLLARLGEDDAASLQLEAALALQPTLAGAWLELGDIHCSQRDLAKALACYGSGLDADGQSALGYLKLGCVLRELGRADEAIMHLRRAYELAPDAVETLQHLIEALIASDLCDKALAVAAQAVQRVPAYHAYLLLAFAYHKVHEPQRALECLAAAQSMRPADARFHDLRGAVLQELGRLPEALEDYERAIVLEPDFKLAAFHRGLARLLTGDLDRGWQDYELRHSVRRRDSALPRWDGSPLAGRTLLVYREQGLGDEIMLASLFGELIAAAGHCIIECDPKLQPLFARSFAGATVFASLPDRELPAALAGRKIDVEIPAGTLPRFFRRRLSDFPRHAAYLRAEEVRIAHWREQLANLGPGLKVGLSWTGGVRKTRRALRSIALERWLPLLRLPAAHFVSLQYTPEAAGEVARLQAQHAVRIHHWDEAISDYDETAALVCALDLVLSVCTSVVHLCGALGQRAWVLAPYSPEWRYGLQGQTMPWYPSVRILRQPTFGEWEPVLEEAAMGLRRLTSG